MPKVSEFDTPVPNENAALGTLSSNGGLRSRSVVALFWFCSIVTTSCFTPESRSEMTAPRAEFGVFFGSQIQQRSELLLQLDESRQRQGFRLEYPRAVSRPLAITWEIDYPMRRTGSHGPGNAPRGIRTGSATMPVGSDRFEQTVALLPTDSPGTWNLRVKADGVVVLDRPFRVVTTTFERRRLTRQQSIVIPDSPMPKA
ncbi:MAG: hypothetical protein QM784_18285 [Polyangiaceae bacterium]